MLVKNSSVASEPIKTPRAQGAGLSNADEQRLKQYLRRRSPSEPWVEAQIRSSVEMDEQGQTVIRRTHDRHAFPPGGAQTAMVRCAACRIFTPPQTLEHGNCLDHGDHRGWGPSPSAVAIRAHEFYQVRIPQIELEPESTEELKREIREAAKKKRRRR